MSRRCAICIGNANGSDPIYLKFLASEVVPKESGRRKSMQKRQGQKIRWRQNSKCVAKANSFEF